MQNHPVADLEIIHEKGNRLEILATTCRNNNVLDWFLLELWSSFSLQTITISDIMVATLCIKSELFGP